MVEEQKPALTASLENVDKPLVVSEDKPAEEPSAQVEHPAEEVKMEEPGSQEAVKPSEQPKETSEAKEDAPPAFEEVKNEEKEEEEKKEGAEGEMAEENKAENGGAAAPTEPVTPAPENAPESMRNVKIARIPKEVVEFMMKDEAEDGTVRINVSQMRYFLSEELWKLAKYVNGSVWDTCEFPVLDMLVPENAKKFLNVQTFNTVKIKDEEKRIAAEAEKVAKLESTQYAKMNDVHKKKVWADMDKKYTVKDNLITRVGLPPQQPPAEKKKNNKPPSVPSQIQPAVPAGPGAPKPGAAAKATPAAQNGANGNKSDNAARKRPNQSGGAGGESSPAKKSKGPENRKSNQGQKGFPRKSGGGANNKFNQRPNAPSRFPNAPSRFESAQPWSNAGPAPFNTQFSNFRGPAAAPAMSYGGYDSLAERERALMERERRLLAAESQLAPTPSYGSTGAYGTGSSDYRTTYDNYANSSFGASSATAGANAYSTPGYGVTSTGYETGGYGSTGTNFSTTNSSYGSFLQQQMPMTHSSPADNRGRGNNGNRRSGGAGQRRF